MKVLIGIVAVIAVVLVVGLLLPTECALARTVKIDAEPAKVHEYVGDLEKWPSWGPWHDMDPTIETTYGEKTTGVGASQSWTSKDGPGELTFTRSDPQTGVAYDMTLSDMPLKGELNYKKVDGGTEVTWSMSGDFDVPVIGGWVKLMAAGSIEKMFDDGLNKLKSQVEG